MHKRFEHTAGPWYYLNGVAKQEQSHTTVLMAERKPENTIRPTVRDENIKRAVACVNGCDAAEVEHPKHLAHCLDLADQLAAVTGAPFGDKLSESQRTVCAQLRAALRAVRGEQ